MTSPTHILSSTQQGTKITVMLYGDVTAERLAKEQRELDHRLDQLNSARPPAKSAPVPNRKTMYQDDEFFDDPFDGPFQSTGR